MCQALTKRKAKCKNRQEPYCYLHKLSMENKTLKESQKKLEKTVKTKNNKIKKIGKKLSKIASQRENVKTDLMEYKKKNEIIENELHAIKNDKADLMEYKKKNEIIENELYAFKNNNAFTMKMAEELDKLRSDFKTLEKYEKYKKYIDTTVMKYGDKNYTRITIWDMVNISNINDIVIKDLGITIDDFEDRFLKLKKKRNKLAHPQISNDRSEIILDIAL